MCIQHVQCIVCNACNLPCICVCMYVCMHACTYACILHLCIQVWLVVRSFEFLGMFIGLYARMHVCV